MPAGHEILAPGSLLLVLAPAPAPAPAPGSSPVADSQLKISNAQGTACVGSKSPEKKSTRILCACLGRVWQSVCPASHLAILQVDFPLCSAVFCFVYILRRFSAVFTSLVSILNAFR